MNPFSGVARQPEDCDARPPAGEWPIPGLVRLGGTPYLGTRCLPATRLFENLHRTPTARVVENRGRAGRLAMGLCGRKRLVRPVSLPAGGCNSLL